MRTHSLNPQSRRLATDWLRLLTLITCCSAWCFFAFPAAAEAGTQSSPAEQQTSSQRKFDEKLFTVLATKSDLDAGKTLSISELLDKLTQRHDVPFSLNLPVLKDAGCSGDTQVKLVGAGESLAELLRQTLTPQKLAVVILPHGLRITTVADAAKNYDRIDLSARTAKTQQVINAMRSKTEFDFLQDSLATVATQLTKRHKISISLDSKSLQAVGLDTDVPITKSLHNISLRSALRASVISELDLTVVIRGDALVITIPEVTGKYAFIDIGTQDDWVARYEAILDQRISIKVTGETLYELLDKLEAICGIPFEVDARSLDDAGLSGETHLSHAFEERKIRDILSFAAAEWEMVYVLRDETVLLSKPERLEQEK